MDGSGAVPEVQNEKRMLRVLGRSVPDRAPGLCFAFSVSL